jgi:uncharacterized protein
MDKTPINRKKTTLNNWEFNRIYIQDKELFHDFIKVTEYPTNLWRSNFDYLWGSSSDKRTVLWKIVDEMLVIFWLLNKKHLIMECLPLGKGGPDKIIEVTYKCLKFCHSYNRKKKLKAQVKSINDYQLDFLKHSTLFNNYFIPIKLNGMERHLGVQNLLSLNGKQFENVRQMVNRFKRKNPNFIVRRATKDDYASLINLKTSWNKKSGSKYDFVWDDYFYQRILRNFERLNHIVLIVEVEEKIEGVITGGILPHGEGWACELKNNKDFKGISEFLYVELAKEINSLDQKVELINIGSDSRGKGGLRSFKEKLRPILNVHRYKLLLK